MIPDPAHLALVEEKSELMPRRALGGLPLRWVPYCKIRDPRLPCIEKRQGYCCFFRQPLSRILQEQIRPPSWHGWVTAKAPSCAGVPGKPLLVRK